MQPEDLFLANLALIDRVTASVCRRNRVSADEAEEFAAHARLKLIEDDYAVLRKFEGRSSFSTYLTTVIHRLFLQYRVQMWGKWRPSAEAKRLGEKAITLERLLTRDGHSLAEAIEILTTGAEPAYTRAELYSMYLRLPARMPRAVVVSDEQAAKTIEGGATADNVLLSADRLQTARKAAAAIDAAMTAMDAEEQIILRMRFWSARSVPEIAQALRTDPKKLYKRIDRLLVALRARLQRVGISAEDVEDLIEHGDQEIVLAASKWEKSEPGRSHTSEMKSAGEAQTSDATL